MAEAVIKVSWRMRQGRADPASAVGGICGTAFTLESGRTFTAAHTMRGVLEPNPGCDRCFVALAGRDGHFSVLRPEQVHPRAGWELAEISGYASPRRYSVSDATVSQDMRCTVTGYRANEAPFVVALGLGGTVMELQSADVGRAAQDVSGLLPQPVSLNVRAADLTITDKPGMVFVQFGKPGLGGAPVLNAADGRVVGMCVLGLPPDAPVKTRIAAIDMRAVLARGQG